MDSGNSNWVVNDGMKIKPLFLARDEDKNNVGSEGNG